MKMFKFFTILVLATVGFSEPINRAGRPILPNGRIVGGSDAVIETYPHQVSLESYGSHRCGGSIVSASYVLTAGHCASSYGGPMYVRAGSTYMGKGGSVHKVDRIVRHEKYYTSQYGIPHYDIALLHVSPPFEFDDTRQPIELFELNEESGPGVNSTITGWGSTGQQSSSHQLQTVSVPIVAKELCEEAYKLFGGLPEGQICAAYYGVGGKDACQGDSGGPLTIDGRLAGVVSWGNGCAQAYYPGVYTEVAHYRDWIDQHLRYE